ncbi:alpha/beta fold hydrolase [Yimella sp. cx-51]|uniref:alpha/beta fold hydrolase n=1 Tax=Yimella sp. cx-51 TaxID=2770551 RepID=UPI00165DA27E|nr:alpha/beta hydrolase [Yimella sp. cx-51]MBC9956224.1 alpha/beta hydrolase [Yimella sp. cx-51]QTH38630.1 alpha/beta hydrolase [Yimella sp. cx-51]
MSSLDTSLPQLAQKWGGEYRSIDLDGPVAYIDFGGPSDAVPFVLVHGLGGMALNYVLLAPYLREAGYRVYAVDLAGHGLTRAVERSSSVRNNAKLVRQFIEEVLGEPAVVAGNSMGGLIVSMLASTHPDAVRGVVLLNPAMPAPRRYPGRQLASLRSLITPAARGVVGKARKRPITPEAEIEHTMRLCFADWTIRDQEMFDAHVDMAKARRRFPEALAALGVAARTMFQETIAHRAVMDRYHRIKAPVLLIHGTHDRLVDIEAARWAKKGNPRWLYAEWDDTGHVPMMEHPERTAKTMLSWVESHGILAA